jgi:hypothetical protein
MFSRAAVCKRYLDHAEQFADHAMFRSLEAGLADASSYDALLRRVALTHLNCPQLIAFLKSVAPTDAPERLRLEFLDPLDAERSGQITNSLETILTPLVLGASCRIACAGAGFCPHDLPIRPVRQPARSGVRRSWVRRWRSSICWIEWAADFPAASPRIATARAQLVQRAGGSAVGARIERHPAYAIAIATTWRSS